MSFAGSRRLMPTSLVVLLIMSVFQIWLCCEYSCQARAIRIFPGNGVAKFVKEKSIDKKISKEELFHKYFSGRTFSLNNKTDDNGFDESKRRVPSCPDPLHN
ncbi:clavata3/esr (cle)-related protein 27 [Fagus crenata]